MKYQTLNPVRHDGKLYPKGSVLSLSETVADTLLACGAIEPVPEKEKTDSKPVSNSKKK